MTNKKSPAPVMAMRNFLPSDDVKCRSSMFIGCYGVNGTGQRFPAVFLAWVPLTHSALCLGGDIGRRSSVLNLQPSVFAAFVPQSHSRPIASRSHAA
jgi:hypothetical protein